MKRLIFIFSFVFGVSVYYSSAQIHLQKNATDEDADYTQGIFFVNEGWFGHENSTLNYLLPDEDDPWIYHAFQRENPGKELGATSQFGTIYGDKFYIVSKQAQDSRGTIVGSRLAVCDAKTLKCLKEFVNIASDEDGKSIADGRSFLGVDEHTGYIGTSNGIWLYDIENMEIGRQIEGTGNPNTEGYGQLYRAQVGTMLRAGDKVFAVHQAEGILVIDALSHKLETVIEGNYGSIIQSLDESLWVSVAANASGDGSALPYMLKINPYTLEIDTLHIPVEEGIGIVPNSWYAWTADGFCSSAQQNKIYWKSQHNNSWDTGKKIYCYDIDNDTFSEVFDVEAYGWILYGTGFRIHPVTDEIYAFLYHNFGDNTYRTLRLSTEDIENKVIREYEMINDYWFPALPVFPDNYAPEVSEIPEIVLEDEQPYTLNLREYVTDRDNSDASIVKSVESVSDESLFTASIEKGNLEIVPVAGKTGEGTVGLKFNSNGKVVTASVDVKIKDALGIEDMSDTKMNHKIYTEGNTIHIENGNNCHFRLYNLNGQLISNFTATGQKFVYTPDVCAGIYILKGENQHKSISIKLILK